MIGEEKLGNRSKDEDRMVQERKSIRRLTLTGQKVGEKREKDTKGRPLIEQRWVRRKPREGCRGGT